MAAIPPSRAVLDDLHTRRRNLLVQRLALSLAGIHVAVVLASLGLALPIVSGVLVLLGVMASLYLAIAWITTRAQTRAMPTLLVGFSLCVMSAVTFANGGLLGIAPSVLNIVLVLASILLTPRSTAIVTVACLLILGLLAVLTAQNLVIPASTPTISLYTVIFAMQIGIVGVFAYLHARWHQHDIAQLVGLADETAAQNAQLVAQQAALVQQAEELEAQRRETAAKTRELQTTLDKLRQSDVALRRSQNPLVPVLDGVVVMSLVGELESSRTAHVLEDVLHGIETRGSHTLVLDVTGVPSLHSDAAQAIPQVAQAARLLGARLILVGVSPPVAHALVGIGVDLSSLDIASDLQSALAPIFLQQTLRLAPSADTHYTITPEHIH
ncbi:MAG: STAS domain-containing protein [Chloroflexi bacterium]|nr:STAS domain-containing protein [Chloroflexota bacterium]